jgi:hypothetical protein
VGSGKTGFDWMSRMNRIGKKRLKNGSEHEADLPRKSAFAKSHPVNPVHPVQNVFRFAALPRWDDGGAKESVRAKKGIFAKRSQNETVGSGV